MSDAESALQSTSTASARILPPEEDSIKGLSGVQREALCALEATFPAPKRTWR
jgi:hypothetical protein